MVSTLITHLNNTFMDAFSDGFDQSKDECMTKCKGNFSMKQYLQLKPTKRGFKWWFRCASSTGYFYKFDLCYGKRKKMLKYILERE